jgi:hypothetical protein
MSSSPLEHVKLKLVRSIADLWAMKEWAGERRPGPLCFDTEGEGLVPQKHKLRLIQLGDENIGWAVPFEMWGGGAVELLTSYQGDLAAHLPQCRFRLPVP